MQRRLIQRRRRLCRNTQWRRRRLLRRHLNYHRSHVTLEDQLELLHRNILFLQGRLSSDNSLRTLAIYEAIYNKLKKSDT